MSHTGGVPHRGSKIVEASDRRGRVHMDEKAQHSGRATENRTVLEPSGQPQICIAAYASVS